MTLVATRAIAAGDAVTRETVKLSVTTQARLEEMRLWHGYTCTCARCAAPDLGFGLPCPAAERCRGTLAPLLPASSARPPVNLDGPPSRRSRTLYAAAAANCDDIAAARLSVEDGSVITSRARVHGLAAKTEMDALRVLECTVAGCDCGAECDSVHPVIKDGVPYAMNALKSLQHASIAAAAAVEAPGANAAAAAAAAVAAARCPRLVPHLRRYVPVVATMLGPQSEEALDMAAALGVLPGGDAPLYCANCCTVPTAAALNLKSCGRCRCVRYCGAACQRAHYARHHKRVCRRFAALVSERGGSGGAGGAAPVDFSGMGGGEGDADLRMFR
ncbi:hypothetical protein JKP88DRAFT_249784 [Tribonema minus]|uniref:MYND-type domain-containing protein n=1 Tax=Tribonema minus TaxID=303371 RepID=A0A836C8E8_9STRA|nr:hypothetical protein JKP88DRAFT_249784 [Tribonema minus]